MSLVEKALRKMQETAPPAPDRAAPPPAYPNLESRDEKAREQPERPAMASNPGPMVPLNMAALRAAGLLPPEHEERQLARQYRQIKRPLILNALGRGTSRVTNGHVIMIASSLPGEGKTFTALNLALSMSMEKDVRLLLADADVAKPHLSRLLGVSDAPGLLDALRDPAADVEGFVRQTSVSNLYFLPAGTPSAEATELLASTRMEQVIRALVQRDRQRVILLDSPPLLRTTESQVLTHIAGQIVVVVRAGETSQQTLLDALTYLGEHPAVSLVLNQSMASAPEGYYHQSGYTEGRSGPAEKQAST